MLYLFLSGPIWFGILLLIEYDVLPSFKVAPTKAPADREEDMDVAAERRRVESGEANEDLVVVRDLKRVYMKDKQKFMAVDGLTFGIRHGECFGLLGVNGAGKTTTFRMLTGDEKPSEGSIVAAGFNLATDMQKARQFIGYCPQYDALIGLLTAREHLIMYARLRCVPEAEIGQLVAELIDRMDLTLYADKPAYTYSGGNKRKLSTAIALIGDPKIVFLDEPSTGVDPASRRFLWKVLEQVKANGQCVVLTSHNMEESEALCSRLVIMVNGRFKCIGAPTRLKDRFGQGFHLHVKAVEGTSAGDLAIIKDYMLENFPESKLHEQHNTSMSFDVPNTGASWGHMFAQLQLANERFRLEDFSLSQTSLEQVFLRFAEAQHSDEGERVGIFGGASAASGGRQSTAPRVQTTLL